MNRIKKIIKYNQKYITDEPKNVILGKAIEIRLNQCLKIYYDHLTSTLSHINNHMENNELKIMKQLNKGD